MYVLHFHLPFFSIAFLFIKSLSVAVLHWHTNSPSFLNFLYIDGWMVRSNSKWWPLEFSRRYFHLVFPIPLIFIVFCIVRSHIFYISICLHLLFSVTVFAQNSRCHWVAAKPAGCAHGGPKRRTHDHDMHPASTVNPTRRPLPTPRGNNVI